MKALRVFSNETKRRAKGFASLERNFNHLLNLSEWAELAGLINGPAYLDHLDLGRPALAATREARVALLAGREKRRQCLWHAGDLDLCHNRVGNLGAHAQHYPNGKTFQLGLMN